MTPRRILVLVVAALIPVAVLGTLLGALSSASDGTASIKAAIVDQDQLVVTTAADGSKSYVAAGRLVVSSLVKQKIAGSDTAIQWQLLKESSAKSDLAAGSISAIITIPKTFSRAISKLGTTEAEQSRITITTDEAHSYLVSQISPVLGSVISSQLGSTTATQTIVGLYTGYGKLGNGYAESADGASKLADGIGSLASGLSQAGSGAEQSASGAQQLSTGVTKYTKGADSIASGLGSASSGLSTLSSGIGQYTGGVTQSSEGAQQLVANWAYLTDAQKQAAVEQLASGLGELSSQGSKLASGAQQASGGIAQLASGAQQLSAGSSALRTGTSSLASGLGSLAGGIQQSAGGATQLQTGAQTLASGLSSASEKTPSLSKKEAEKVAKVAITPAVAHTTRLSSLDSLAQAAGAFVAPAALWLGAGATILLFGAVARRRLTDGVSSGRLLGAAFLRGGAVVLAQTVLLMVLVQWLAPVPWVALPAVAGICALAALCFLAVSQLLSIAFGSRMGSILGLLLVVIQLVATGTLFPISLVAAPFQTLSGWLPIPAAASAIQAVAAGSSSGVAAEILLLVGIAVIAFGISVAVLARRRGSAAFYARLAATAG